MHVAYRRLPLDGLKNIRDLGGYPVNMDVTQYGRFIRSSSTDSLTNSDMIFLRKYGVKTVIDLRTNEEILEAPSSLSSQEWVAYVNYPMEPDNTFEGEYQPPGSKIDYNINWAVKYTHIAEQCKKWIATVFKTLANYENAVIFYCTTGKDRTGIIAALLLSVCGVCEYDVIADYCVSQLYLEEKYISLLETTSLIKKRCEQDKLISSSSFFKTEPHNMKHFLNYLSDKYGGVQGYLCSCGISLNVIERLRIKMLVH